MTHPTAPVGELTEILSGFAFKSEQFNNSGEGLPLIRIRDVVEGVSDTYYSGDYKSEFLVKNGDALIGMDGQFNLACWRGGPALLNQRVCKIKATDERLYQGYLLRFLPAVLKEIEDRTPFVTVKHLSVKSLREIEIPLPPLPNNAVSRRFWIRPMCCAPSAAKPSPSSINCCNPCFWTCSATR